MTDTSRTAKNILADSLGVEMEAIENGASIETLESWDSLSHMRLIIAIETFLGETIEPEILVGISNLADIEAVIADHAKA